MQLTEVFTLVIKENLVASQISKKKLFWGQVCGGGMFVLFFFFMAGGTGVWRLIFLLLQQWEM